MSRHTRKPGSKQQRKRAIPKIDLRRAFRAIKKIRKDSYVSPKRRREPITI